MSFAISVHKRVLTAIASFLLVFPALADDAPKPAPITPEAVEPAPKLQWLDADGHEQVLNPVDARVTLVHLWATWCTPCLKELPEVDKVAADYKAKGLRVVALALDGAKAQRIKDFFAARGITHLDANYDRNNFCLQALHGEGLPLSALIDHNGNIIAQAVGPVEWSADMTKKTLDGALKAN